MNIHADYARMFPGAHVIKNVQGVPVVFLKSQPTAGDVHVNTPLTNISVAFMQDASAFVADRVFPNIPVSKRSDVYYLYDRGFFYRSEMEKRAPGTETKGIGYNVSTDNYACDVWGIHRDIDDQVRANADAAIDPDRDATNLITGQALLKKETLWASNYFVTGKWTTDFTGVASGPTGNQFLQWNDANSTPIEDIRTGKQTIMQSVGGQYEPNTLVLDLRVYNKLIDHPEIVDRVKFSGGVGNTNPAMISRQALATLFEVQNILVMSGVQNTAKEGQTNSMSFIGGKNALLCYVPPAPGLMIPSAGYTFSWNGYLGATNGGMRIKRFRIEQNASDRVEMELAFVQKLVSADLGHFFANAVA